MQNHDYVPRRDLEFYEWQNPLMSQITQFAEQWHIPNETIKLLTELQTKWTTLYQLSEDPKTSTKVIVAQKQLARKEYEKQIRSVVNMHISYNSNVTDSQRVTMGVRVRKTMRTPISVPLTVPFVISVDINTHRQVIISFRDSERFNKAKPEGVIGAVVKWMLSDVPVTDINHFTNSELCTRSPITIRLRERYQGKRLYFVLAWQNKKGALGLFGEIHNSIVK
jgi:hypothetical protein